MRQTQRTLGAVLATTDPALAIGTGVCTILAGLARDLDSYVDDRSLAHRGPTHTLPFATLLAILAGGASQLVVSTPLPGALAALLGVCSHLAGDALNPMGVPIAWPVSDRHYRLFDRDGDGDGEEERGVCNAGNELANRLLLALGGVLTLLAIGALVLPPSIPSLSITTNSP